MKLSIFLLASVFAQDIAYDDLANKTKCKKPADCDTCESMEAVSTNLLSD